MNNAFFGLNQVLVSNKPEFEEKVKCGIITLYLVWTELRPGFSNLYLVSGIIYYHQYYTSLVLQTITSKPSTPVICIWDTKSNSFQLEFSKQTQSPSNLTYWKIHMVHHLLELLRTILRTAPSSANALLAKQCTEMIRLNYYLITCIYRFIENDSQYKEIITSIISTTEEVSYSLIRRIPSLFNIIIDTINSDEKLFKIYIDITGFLPSLLSNYAHITTFYLFISKDRTKTLARKVLSQYLEQFVDSIIKVLINLKAAIANIEIAGTKSNNEIDKSITEYLEKIMIVKCAYYILLSLQHCFELEQNSADKIDSVTYIKIYEHLSKITKFTELTFMNRSLFDDSYNFPEDFRNSDIKQIPGSRNYIVVDFEHENEDDLFRLYITSVISWLWHLSSNEGTCSEIIIDPGTRELFRICYIYEMWNIHSYMAICGLIYSFTIVHARSVLNCLKLTISIIVKYISELKIPIEGYLLLFQVIREIYTIIISPSIIQEIQQIIAPLRTLLSSDLPMLKYYNYPLLKEIVPFNKKKVAIGEDQQKMILEDENDTRHYFPKQLLKKLPIISPQGQEAYPGQFILQTEAKLLIKMVTPITHEGIKRTNNQIKYKFKAGEDYLLDLNSTKKVNREDRMSLLFSGVGSHIISNHYSISQDNIPKNKETNAKLEEGFQRLMLDMFDEEHGIKN
jgi:hypothetical protein